MSAWRSWWRRRRLSAYEREVGLLPVTEGEVRAYGGTLYELAEVRANGHTGVLQLTYARRDRQHQPDAVPDEHAGRYSALLAAPTRPEPVYSSPGVPLPVPVSEPAMDAGQPPELAPRGRHHRRT